MLNTGGHNQIIKYFIKLHYQNRDLSVGKCDTSGMESILMENYLLNWISFETCHYYVSGLIINFNLSVGGLTFSFNLTVVIAFSSKLVEFRKKFRYTL